MGKWMMYTIRIRAYVVCILSQHTYMGHINGYACMDRHDIPANIYRYTWTTTNTILMKLDHKLHHLWCSKVCSHYYFKLGSKRIFAGGGLPSKIGLCNDIGSLVHFSNSVRCWLPPLGIIILPGERPRVLPIFLEFHSITFFLFSPLPLKVEGGYVFTPACLSICLSVCRISQKVVHGSLWNLVDRLGGEKDKLVRFWWRSESRSGYENF